MGSSRSSAPSRSEAKARSLAPKEHGAYAQLALPLIAAFAGGRPTTAALLVAIAASCVFAAHEPILVAIGRRGGRAAAIDGPRARKRATFLIATSVASALGAAAIVGRALAVAAIPAIVLGAIVALLVSRDDEKTTFGELTAAAALSAAALPTAIAAGWEFPRALAAWATFVLAFGAATLGVRAVLAKAKRRGPFARVAPLVANVVLTIVVALIARPIAIAALPTVLVSTAIGILAPHPRALAKMGWTLVVASLATTILVVIFARS
jgi:hypothetical protein